MLFGDWISRTRELQVRAYGSDPGALTGEPWANFMRWNFLAAMAELAESLAELPWKPWSAKHRARLEDPRNVEDMAREIEARDRAVEEIVDVLHFAANILCALECSDEELNERYEAKMALNAARQESGY